ncbi:hypothetical protein EYF80_053827 [Liparis tanakae]|uniref:Uncharacterized protein n=1 Tax=Liparis tanakae TaxID=230148 RepID=A0A4Z2F4E5_9TELE|nr:hypothetical protein EYF80_053827 [Liparis tanakae]
MTKFGVQWVTGKSTDTHHDEERRDGDTRAWRSPPESPEFTPSATRRRTRGSRRGSERAALPSDLGLEHLQEEFVHGHLSLHLDAVKVLHGLGGRLPQEGQRHEQLARPPRVLLVLAALVVLQGLVQGVLQLLHRLHVLYVHGV